MLRFPLAYRLGMAAYLAWASLEVSDAPPVNPFKPGTKGFDWFERGWRNENNDLFDVIKAITP